MSNSTRPNLFAYAPGELTQDAFLCWLLEWANKKNSALDPALHQTALAFLNSLLKLHGYPPVQGAELKITRQYRNIDILVEVLNGPILIIEDKTHSSEHGDQLKRYLEEANKGFKGREILPTLLKTGDQSNFKNVEREGFEVYSRIELLNILRVGREKVVTNDIFVNFLDHLEALEAGVQSYIHLPISEWSRSSWTGFYIALQKAIPSLQWEYVSNPSGGFLGAHWHWVSWGTYSPHLQIVDNRKALCLKVEFPTRINNRQEVVDSCYRELKTAAEKHNMRVSWARTRAGAYMTVATFDNWLMENDGRLDFNATVSRLKQAEAVVSLVAKSIAPAAIPQN